MSEQISNLLIGIAMVSLIVLLFIVSIIQKSLLGIIAGIASIGFAIKMYNISLSKP